MENKSRELGFPSNNNYDVASIIELGIAGYKLFQTMKYLYNFMQASPQVENVVQNLGDLTNNVPNEVDEITQNLQNTNLNNVPVTDQDKTPVNTNPNEEKGWLGNWTWEDLIDNCRIAYIQWSVVNIISNCQDFLYLRKVCRELPKMINDGPYKEKLIKDIKQIKDLMSEFSLELKDIYKSETKRETEKGLKLLKEKFQNIMNKFDEMIYDVKAVLEETKKLKSKQKLSFWKNLFAGIVGIGLCFGNPAAAGARVAAGFCSAGNLICACVNLHFINELGQLIQGYEEVKTNLKKEQIKNQNFSTHLEEKINSIMQQANNLSNEELNEITRKWKNIKNNVISYEELRDSFNNGKLTTRSYINSVFHNLFN